MAAIESPYTEISVEIQKTNIGKVADNAIRLLGLSGMYQYIGKTREDIPLDNCIRAYLNEPTAGQGCDIEVEEGVAAPDYTGNGRYFIRINQETITDVPENLGDLLIEELKHRSIRDSFVRWMNKPSKQLVDLDSIPSSRYFNPSLW